MPYKLLVALSYVGEDVDYASAEIGAKHVDAQIKEFVRKHIGDKLTSEQMHLIEVLGKAGDVVAIAGVLGSLAVGLPIAAATTAGALTYATAKKVLMKALKESAAPDLEDVASAAKKVEMPKKSVVDFGDGAGKSHKKIDFDVEALNKRLDNLPKPDISHLPELRQEYIKEVWGLRNVVDDLIGRGYSAEEVAKTVSQMRRDAGIKYKSLTPDGLLNRISKRNENAYNNDKFGPTVKSLRDQGRSWEDIIESSLKPGGGDIDFFDLKK